MPMALLVMVLALVAAAVVLTSRRGPLVPEWAAARSIVLTGDNQPVVEHYLQAARRLRTIGGVAGGLLPVAVRSALGADGNPWGGGPSGTWLWVLAGYLVGVLCAEVALGRPFAPGARTASVLPRRVADYVPRGLLWAERSAGALAPVLAVGVVVTGVKDSNDGMEHLTNGAALALGAAGLCIAAAVEGVQRWVVTRPQPVRTPDLLEADDAIRSQSIASIGAAGLGIVLLVLSRLLWSLALSDVQVLRWTAWVPAIGCSAVAVFSCTRLGHAPWRVRRTYPGDVETNA